MNALDRPIPVTFFKTYAADTKREEAYAPRALADRIRTVTAAQKAQLPWLKLARFGETRSDKNSLRHDANVLTITGIEADYDGGVIPVDEACDRLTRQGVAAIVYTSPSHTEDAPRWRVLCPLSEQMPPHRRRDFLGRLNGLLGGIFARESFTLSQSYYFGSVRHNPSHRVELIDGSPIDQHDDLDEIWVGPSNAPATGAENPDATGDEREIAELVRRIVTAEELHTCLTPLAARLIGRNVPATTIAELLRGMMLARPEQDRDQRWQMRFAEIGRLVESAARKYAKPAAQRRDSGRVLAKLACRMFRDRVPGIDILKRLDFANAELDSPVSAEKVRDIALWAAHAAGGENV